MNDPLKNEKPVKKHICVGMLAHVDSGKTTLSEAILYQCGAVRKLGRVDQGNAFLDYDHQEKQRGITIFAKEAICHYHDCEIMLLDTPGHVDFSAEMERTLQVLDVAILIISASDGIQAHSETIYRLLQHYQIPIFLFVNKMDIAHTDKATCMAEMQQFFGKQCLDFTTSHTQLQEAIAMCDDSLLETYLEYQTIDDEAISDAIYQRKIMPCYFGSALKNQGVDALLEGLCVYTKAKIYPQEFGARVYKISHDEMGNRLTHLKITGGTLKVKQVIENEKVDQIRRYHGHSFITVPLIEAGKVCVVKGFQQIQAGTLLGMEKIRQNELLSATMTYRLCPPQGCDAFAFMKQIRPLIEEDPSLHIRYDNRLKEIHLQLRGDVQMEVLTKLIHDRFHMDVTFDEGRIAYRETIYQEVEGVGHYEPLGHYAEVHVRLTPLPRNSGLVIEADCSPDMVLPSIQHTIVNYLRNEDLIGVLSGSPLCDMKITLINAKAHEKHTSGGDFREAARRAVRQGLKMTQCQLLEPYMHFRLQLPYGYVSRAMYDLDRINAQYEVIAISGDTSLLRGMAPLRYLRTYEQEVHAYTKGRGKLMLTAAGYEVANHMEQVLREIAYDDERDVEHPSGSIFCIHGSGVYVPWDQVYEHMHLPLLYEVDKTDYPKAVHRQIHVDEEEVQRVVAKLHQPRKKWKKASEPREVKAPVALANKKQQLLSCLLVDGYNMIFAWPDLKEIANTSIDSAKARLLALLGSYQGYRRCFIIVVFDAYRTMNKQERIMKDHNIYVIYTKTAQTADSYIEKTTHTLAQQYQITVATSDAQEQNIILGQGAIRLSAMELYDEVHRVHHSEMKQQQLQPQFRHMALSDLRKWNEKEEE